MKTLHRATAASAKTAFGLVAMVALVVVAQASGARPATVVCGQTLTASTRLANDLVNCPGTALTIGADGITVDLNGHTLDGTGAAGSEGIADDGHPNVRIEHGTIQQFRVDGVGLRGAAGSVVEHVVVREIGAGRGEAEQTEGIAVVDSAGALIAHNRLDDNCLHGMFLSSSPSSRVVGNELDDNCSAGLEVVDSDSISIVGNRARGNDGSAMGINNVRGATVVGNEAEDGFFGFVMSDLRDSEVALNRVAGNRAGLDLFPESTGNRFVSNRFTGNDVGLVIESDDNFVAWNVVLHNQNPDDPDDPGGGIGIFGTGNTLLGNVANQNGNERGGDGIFVGVPGNTLSRNVANRNGGHGIEAEPGTIDGGGNRAHANALQPDCIGIVCS